MPAHPKMYHDDDQYLNQLRTICLSFPEAYEKEAWGRPTFRAGKIFVTYGSGKEHPHSFIFKPDQEDSTALAQDGRVFIPPYYGPYGWLGLDLDAAEVDWQEVNELVEASYRQIAIGRMLKALDGR